MNHKIPNWNLNPKYDTVLHSWLQRKWKECHKDKKTFTTFAKCHRCVLHISAQPSVTRGDPHSPPHPARSKKETQRTRRGQFLFFKIVKPSTLIKNDVPCVKRQLVAEKNNRCFGRNSWHSFCCFKDTLWFATCEPCLPTQSLPAALSVGDQWGLQWNCWELNSRCALQDLRSCFRLYNHKHKPRDSRRCLATTDVHSVSLSAMCD